MFAQQVDDVLVSRKAKTILLYASLTDEVPTLDYIEECPCQCVLPCVVDEENLELRYYSSREDLVVRGKFKIPEPTGKLFSDYAKIDVAFIPGMAFDRQGHRLGRGKGYYDRLLSSSAFKKIHKIGVCFDFQLQQEVPSEAHDCLVDELLVIPTA